MRFFWLKKIEPLKRIIRVLKKIQDPWGQFALPKSLLYMGMGTLCTAEKPPMYGHGDTLHCQKAPYIWAWGQFALPKSLLNMGMEEEAQSVL